MQVEGSATERPGPNEGYRARREQRAADQRRLAWQLLGTVVLGGFMLRWSLNEETEWLKHGMMLVAGLALLAVGFGAGELYRLRLILRGYDEALLTTDVAIRSVPDRYFEIEGWKSAVAKVVGVTLGAAVLLVIATLI